MIFTKFDDELPPIGEPIMVAWASGAKQPGNYTDSVPHVLRHAVTREECPGEGFVLADATGGFSHGDCMPWSIDELPTHWAHWPRLP